MKLALTVLFTLLFYFGFAQTITRPELDKFVGDWSYINGNTSFTIKLKKLTYWFKSVGKTEEILMGTHCYIENGVLVDDTHSVFPLVGQDKKGSLFLYIVTRLNTPNEIYGNLRDAPKHSFAEVKFIFIGGTPNQMTFEIERLPDVIFNPATQYGTSFPTGIITFTKQ